MRPRVILQKKQQGKSGRGSANFLRPWEPAWSDSTLLDAYAKGLNSASSSYY